MSLALIDKADFFKTNVLTNKWPEFCSTAVRPPVIAIQKKRSTPTQLIMINRTGHRTKIKNNDLT